MPSPINIVIIGGNAAGPAAAAKAKRISPESNVIMFESGDFISTGTCELPYVLSGHINNYQDIIFFSASSFEQSKGVKTFTKHYVEKIDRKSKTIFVKNISEDKLVEVNYYKLILATGSKAKTLPAIHSGFENVFTLKNVSDLLRIRDYINNNQVRKVLIIGASFIGLEAAESFCDLGFSVTVLEKEPLPLPSVDEEVQRLVLELLKNNKIEFLGNAKKIKFERNENKITHLQYDGWQIEYDLILQAIGFEPNNTLAQASKIKIGKFGGIQVDQKLKTSDTNIYSAGDCIEVVNKITSRNEYMPLATFAHKMGHIAGENAAGGNAVAKPVIKNIAVKIFDKNLVTVGLNSLEAESNNFNFIAVSSVAQNIIKVMPDSQNIFGKLIFEKNSKKILGAVFLGSKEVIGYGDIISTFIQNNIKATELADANYNYTPPLSPFVNLLSILGRKSKEVMK